MKKLNSLKVTVTEKAEAIKDTAGNKYEELISNADKLSDFGQELSKQYSDIISGFKELSSRNRIADRLLHISATIRKTAEGIVRDTEKTWNDIKSFFSDTENKSE